MFDELYPAERDASLSQFARRTFTTPEPGAFQGFGSALADVLPAIGNSAASAFSAVIDAYGKAATYRDASSIALLHGKPDPDPIALKRDTIDKMGDSELARDFRQAAKRHTPDPAAVGTAGQIAHGVLVSLGKATAYSVAAGPVGGAILFGGDTGINRAQELSDKGVDDGTAAVAGTISGVAGAVGMALPAAMGATRLQSTVIGATMNPAMNVAEVGGIRGLLQHADYQKVAAQYDPFDPVSLSVAAITGGAFGAAFHRARVNTGKTLTPDEHAAALTMHEVDVRDADTLVPKADIAAANQARDAQIMAREQLDAGEPVSVAHQVQSETGQLLSAWDRVYENPLGPADDPLVRMTPESIDEVLVERGDAWLGKDGLTIRTGREGLVKIIIHHGPESTDAFPVTREDVAALPKTLRRYKPIVETGATGRSESTWVIDRGADVPPLVVVVKESSKDGLNRLITMYADQRNPARTRSEMREGPFAEVLQSSLASHATGDTAQAPLPSSPESSASSLTSNIAQPGILQKLRDGVASLMGKDEPAAVKPLADTPEQMQAMEIASRNPDALVRMDDDTEVRMADLLQQAHEAETQTKTDSAAFAAAVNCAIRFPQ